MITHEFILCEKIPEKINFNDFSRDKMVVIDDNFILKNPVPFKNVKMYSQHTGNLMLGLSYHGISILDSDMANELKKELLNNCDDCIDLQKLIETLEQCIAEKKFIIHFGV